MIGAIFLKTFKYKFGIKKNSNEKYKYNTNSFIGNELPSKLINLGMLPISRYAENITKDNLEILNCILLYKFEI